MTVAAVVAFCSISNCQNCLFDKVFCVVIWQDISGKSVRVLFRNIMEVEERPRSREVN